MEDNQKINLILSKLEKLEQMENDIRDIKLVLEKDVRVNMKQLMDKNFEISQNIHNVMETKDEVLMLGIKIRMLESEVRELKRKIS